jgi:sugar phosphate permease
MTQRERHGWFIVASLFFTLLIVFGGGYDTVPVFLPALLRGFPNWDRSQVSLLPSVLAASAGISVLPVGWLVDRIEARIVMIGGALCSGAAFLIASQANSLMVMIVAYLLLGIGISAGTVLPASLVVANWFTARRGMAMGITNSGSTAGGMVMTLVAGFAIVHWGWRAAYIALGAPMVLIAIPLVLLVVRSRPPGAVKLTVAQSADLLEGFETGAAVRTRSFWMLVIVNFSFAFAATGTLIHMVAHLEEVGYTRANAAFAVSLIFGMATVGKVTMGFLADRMTARRALALNFGIQAAGLVLVFGVANTAILTVFILVYGISVAAPLMLLPLVNAESLGLKRFGAISGLTGLAQTFGGTVGPLASGWIYDLTKSYTRAFELIIAINILAVFITLACRSYQVESSGKAVPAGQRVTA